MFAQRTSSFDVPAWAWPSPAPSPRRQVDTVTRLHVPNSSVAFTAPQTTNTFAPPDWHPETHPAPPPIVAHGRRPAIYACGYCHLPDGRGRPENAQLAGLPVDYFIQEVAEIRAGTRKPAWPKPFRPSDLMRTMAESATVAEVREAAEYFAKLPRRPATQIVESDSMPCVLPSLGLYIRDPAGGIDTVGHRIIEFPHDAELHELRDSQAEYIAYVPKGSAARGKMLATVTTSLRPKVCVTCHGPELRGVKPAPPIAGRSPSYIVRQLLAFKAGTRSSEAASQMRDVVANLTVDDMIAVSAYVASRKP